MTYRNYLPLLKTAAPGDNEPEEEGAGGAEALLRDSRHKGQSPPGAAEAVAVRPTVKGGGKLVEMLQLKNIQ